MPNSYSMHTHMLPILYPLFTYVILVIDFSSLLLIILFFINVEM